MIIFKFAGNAGTRTLSNFGVKATGINLPGKTIQNMSHLYHISEF